MGRTVDFQPLLPQPLGQQVLVVLLAGSPLTINNTCPLPATCVKAVARLFCGMASSAGRSGMKFGLEGIEIRAVDRLRAG